MGRVFAARHKGELLCLFGVAPYGVLRGAPWLLATPALDHHAKALVRDGRDVVCWMREQFPVLVNYVHAENARSVAWLARLGFTIAPPAPYGPRGALFHKFTMG